jgi:3'(2'), 5'-bisphosphate nucleotidase
MEKGSIDWRMGAPNPALLGQLVPDLVAIAEAAGDLTLGYFRSDLEVTTKSDASPVTAADRAAESLILEGLARLTPELPVISEEAASTGPMPRPPAGPFWLVDPLDGTREFIAGRDEFTVNIGLIWERRPVLGVVHAPARKLTYAGCEGEVSEKDHAASRPIRVRTHPVDGLVVVASRSHRTAQEAAYLKDIDTREVIGAGSSLKFCVVAAGAADLYPRFGPTMEWDTAAGHAILAAAGGSVSTVDGAPLRYGKPGFRNPAFIAKGGV